MEEKKWGLSGGTLKIIALVSMIIDHATAVFVNYYDYEVLYNMGRCIGRLAFPLYCFLLVEGFCYTRNVKKYCVRLFLFAIISEVPFDLAFFRRVIYMGHQNVFFTLLLGILLIWNLDRILKKKNSNWIGNVLNVIGAIVIYVLSSYIYSDYGVYGVLLIALFYLFRGNKGKVAVSNIGFNFIFSLGSIRQLCGMFSVPIIALYNGKKGVSLKYFFYLIYPLHLLLFYWIKVYC